MNKFLTLLSLFVTLGTLGQDQHFSQIHLMPLYLNPAMTGFFEGDLRVGAIYRNQWSSIQSRYGSTRYETYGAYLDGALLRRKLKGDYLGIGFSAFRDRAGDLGLTTTLGQLSIAYSKSFGHRTKHSLSLGIQGDFSFKGFSSTADRKFTDGIPENITRNVIGIDATAGLRYHVAFKQRFNMYAGFAYAHLLQPAESLSGTGTNRVQAKYTASLGAQVDVNDRFNIVPTALFLMQGTALQVNVAACAQYIFGDIYTSRNSLSFGLGTRFAKPTPDALIPQIKLELYHVLLGVACDINVSSLNRATTSFGAIELGVQYIYNRKQISTFTNTRCPRF